MKQTVDIIPRMDPRCPERKALQDNAFKHALQEAVREHVEGTFFHVGAYPADDGHPRTRTPFEIQQPVTYAGTESYQDNKEVLEQIDALTNTGSLATIICGDQQTFARMVCLRRLDPELFSHIVPLPGEMHLCAHFLHAVWRLYWNKYLHWFAVRMEMEATIKEEWPVKQWNPHDDFMFIILSACLRFLGRHCPPHLFEYDRCLRAAQGNINLQMMLHFVYDCGLPYLILRNSIRKHPNAEIRKQILLVYNVCMHLCRPNESNKFQYAILCVQGVWTYYNMIPCLRRIWDRMSTVSLSGFPGRNVAIDHLCEKVNLSSKVIIGNYPTNGRIRTWVPALNILMPCQAYYFNYMASIGHDDDDEDDDRRSQKADREATIQAAETLVAHAVGDTWDDATNDNDDICTVMYAGAREGLCPWEIVEQKQADWHLYVLAKQEEMLL